MASVTGSQYVFVASQKVNLVFSTDGNASNLPAPLAGAFNLELIQVPSGSTFPNPTGYQGVAILPGGTGQVLQLLAGDYGVIDTSTGDSIIAGTGSQTITGAVGDSITGGSGALVVNALAANEL